ncbi:MAG: hypothetical protein WCG25_02815 [bacterium]
MILNEEANKIEYFDRENLPANTSLKQVERINDYFQKNKGIIMKKQF